MHNPGLPADAVNAGVGASPPPLAFSTPADAPRWQRWLRYSAVARIALFAAATAVVVVAMRLLTARLGWSGTGAPAPWRAASFFLSVVLPALAGYLFLCRVVERRWPEEFGWRRVLPDGAIGTVAGLLLLTAVMATLWVAGAYRITGANPQTNWWIPALVVGLGAGLSEEIVLRGVLFRITEEGLGTWAALALSSLVFGIVHLGNPHATAWSAFAIALEAGVLLALIYHVWRSLPLCVGVHMGWNIAEGPLYGTPVSGSPTRSWLTSTLTGPEWLTGGAFGVETSVLAVGMSLACSLVLVALALRRRSIVPVPFLRRRAEARAHGAVAIPG